MSYQLTLRRIGRVADLGSDMSIEPSHIVSLSFSADYDITQDAVLFDGFSEMGEYTAAFIEPDGSGLILVTSEPGAYLLFMSLMNSGDVGAKTMNLMSRGSPGESILSPGDQDPNADRITLTAHATLW